MVERLVDVSLQEKKNANYMSFIPILSVWGEKTHNKIPIKI